LLRREGTPLCKGNPVDKPPDKPIENPELSGRWATSVWRKESNLPKGNVQEEYGRHEGGPWRSWVMEDNLKKRDMLLLQDKSGENSGGIMAWHGGGML